MFRSGWNLSFGGAVIAEGAPRRRLAGAGEPEKNEPGNEPGKDGWLMKKILWSLIVLPLLASAAGGADDPLPARRAFREAVAADPGCAARYLADPDPEIRRYAVYLLAKKDGPGAIPVLENAVRDSDETVRLTAVAALSAMARREARAHDILARVAREDASGAVRQVAVRASWPFHREIKLLRDDPSWDYEVRVVKTLDLPRDGWKFITDPRQEGHRKGYFEPRFDDSRWHDIKIGTWESQCAPDYDGAAWYRIHFTMPEKIDCNAVEIAFGAVDESAWVWLNGVYLGAHDIGPEGWNKPFAVDCRKEILWGRDNVLTVRVLDTAAAGGIWKPVRIEVLK